MRLVMAAILVCFFAPDLAWAAKGKMVCDNPRRSYLVKFDDELGAFVLAAEEGETSYVVKSVSLEHNGAIFKGDTTSGGPTFQAFTFGRKRVEFYQDNQRIQIDFCH